MGAFLLGKTGMEIDYYIGIPSYQRAEKQSTLELLREFDFPKDRVFLSTQTEEDFRAYQIWKGYCREILFRNGKNVSCNMNTILDHFSRGDKVIFLDDDIRSFFTVKGGAPHTVKKEEFYSMIDEGFSLAKKERATAWGIYPVNNPFFMKDKLRRKSILIGTLMGITKTDLKFNESFCTKQDYEFCLHTIKKYGKCLRLDWYSANASHQTKGGCETVWKEKRIVRADTNRLLLMYPDLIKRNPSKPDEIKMRSTV